MPPVIPLNHHTNPAPYLLISNVEAYYKVSVADVMYCSSHNSYTEFVMTDGNRLVSALGLCYYESLLTPYGFCRIHKSFLLNITYLRIVCKRDETNTVLLLNGEKLPVARTLKTKLLQQLKQSSIEGETDEKEIKQEETEIPNSRSMLPVNRKSIPFTH